MQLTPKTLYTIAALAAVGVVAYVAMRGFRGAGRDIGGAAGDMVTGLVEGSAESFGVPRTNQTECERAKAEGRTWDASFACPAGDFLRYVWD